MDPFVAEIRLFGCNFAPKGWAQCNGQTLPIAQNTALFSLLGTTYGGDGRTNFALPNIQGQTTLQWGQGAGLTQHPLGEAGGQATVALDASQMPAHNHTPAAAAQSTLPDPGGNVWGNPGNRRPAPNFYATSIGTPQAMNPAAIQSTGGGQGHNNLMPYLTMNYCIALQGIYPSRS